jgi:hypothetical protein
VIKLPLCGAAHVPFVDIHDVTVGCEGQLGVEIQKVEDPEVYGTTDLLAHWCEVIVITGRWSGEVGS